MLFRDRQEAGRQLAARLEGEAAHDPVVLALPRGGVPIGAELARRLGAPLDVLMVRTLGAPGQPELAMGAVARTGESTETVLNDDVVRALAVSRDELAAAKAAELEVIAGREAQYHGRCARPALGGRGVILVDDGVATGATTRAALRAARKADPARLVLAVPVGPPDTLAKLKGEADEIVCLHPRPDLGAIGMAYEDFRQVCDAEVIRLLDVHGLSS